MILKIDSTITDQVKVEIVSQTFKFSSIEKRTKGSQVLLRQILILLKENKKNMKDINSIEVNVGPGSFTGTRVGISIANALGYALNIPVNGEKGKIALPIYSKSRFDKKL